MQDIHSIGSGGGAGRFFGGGDRRLRINNHQAIKCPRCESLNTKFCYYNNYNLSQPRHFCKSCRRYWTKGGVLRSVPVGGGCRKPKKSKTTSSDAEDPPPSPRQHRRKLSSSQNSSTESSSLTGTTPPSVAAGTDVVSGTSSNSSSTWLFNILPLPNAPRNPNPNCDLPQPPPVTSSCRGLLPPIGAFTNLMTSSGDVGFATADMTSYRLQGGDQNRVAEDTNSEQQWMEASPNLGEGFIDQTAEIELPGWPNGAGNGEDANSIRNDGLGVVDWGSGGSGNGENDGAIFDLTGAIEQSYWSWADHDHQINYLP